MCVVSLPPFSSCFILVGAKPGEEHYGVQHEVPGNDSHEQVSHRLSSLQHVLCCLMMPIYFKYKFCVVIGPLRQQAKSNRIVAFLLSNCCVAHGFLVAGVFPDAYSYCNFGAFRRLFVAAVFFFSSCVPCAVCVLPFGHVLSVSPSLCVCLCCCWASYVSS